MTAVRSEGLSFHSHKEAVSLLDTWRRRKEITKLSPTHSTERGEFNSLDETINVFRLCQEFYCFLEDYTRDAPPPTWTEPSEWQGDKVPITLSLIEKSLF
jgi:hypothetical protein